LIVGHIAWNGRRTRKAERIAADLAISVRKRHRMTPDEAIDPRAHQSSKVDAHDRSSYQESISIAGF